jgi:predicted phosphodiesterase
VDDGNEGGNSLKIAVISDVHGFSLALAGVLADIAREPGIDRVISAGDLCEGGPDPRGSLEAIRVNGIDSVRGNTDRDLVDGTRTSASATWVREQIGKAGIEQLAALPVEIRVSPPMGNAWDDDLLVVHANPFDLDRHVAPGASDRELEELIGPTRAAVIAFGHLHIAYQREWNGIQLIDVSSVGNSKDGDLRSKWGLCSWDAGTMRWSTELRYVDYPLEETLIQMRESGMPNWEKAAAKLQRASYGKG